MPSGVFHNHVKYNSSGAEPAVNSRTNSTNGCDAQHCREPSIGTSRKNTGSMAPTATTQLFLSLIISPGDIS